MREGEEWTRVCGYEKSKISKCYIRMLLQVLYARRDIQEESIMEKKKKKKPLSLFIGNPRCGVENKNIWKKETRKAGRKDKTVKTRHKKTFEG